MPKPIRIAITGAAGQIAYQLLFRLSSGEVFGCDQPLILSLLEVPGALLLLEGVKMELQDCAFPLLQAIDIASNPYEAFKDIDYALLIGAKPRGPGMERKDLLTDNGKIFVEQGKALNEQANSNVKVFVIGNPCNTNCLIALSHAPRLSRQNFYAMTRLDQNRATFFLGQKAHVPVTAISHMTIWGNHSSTQVPDFFHAQINHESAESLIHDQHWLENEFLDLVRKRGSAIIQARGKSSAASAAQAIIDMIKDVTQPTKKDDWYSCGIISDNNPYRIQKDLIFSFPCWTTSEGEISIVENLAMSEWLLKLIKLSEQELIEEREMIDSLINKG